MKMNKRELYENEIYALSKLYSKFIKIKILNSVILNIRFLHCGFDQSSLPTLRTKFSSAEWMRHVYRGQKFWFGALNAYKIDVESCYSKIRTMINFLKSNYVIFVHLIWNITCYWFIILYEILVHFYFSSTPLRCWEKSKWT